MTSVSNAERVGPRYEDMSGQYNRINVGCRYSRVFVSVYRVNSGGD